MSNLCYLGPSTARQKWETYMKWPVSDIGHQTGQGHCWEKENNKASPLIAPAYSLERIPRPQHSKGKPRQSQLFPCVQICKWEHREMMAARFFWENTGEESMVQEETLSTAEESPFIHGWGLIGACMGRSYWRPGKESSPGSRERKNLKDCLRAKHALCSCQSGKPSSSKNSRYSSQKCTVWVLEPYWSRIENRSGPT